jgi:hypothetical protein
LDEDEANCHSGKTYTIYTALVREIAPAKETLGAVQSCVGARTMSIRAGSLCSKRSNNNNQGFSGFLKVGGGGNFLKFSQRRDPFLRTLTRGAILSPAFDLALPSGPHH